MILESFIVLSIAMAFALFIPGFERKVHARIQRRRGPPIWTPGLWSVIKFCYKKERGTDSPQAGLYKATLAVSFFSTCMILLFSTPYWADALGFGTLLGIAGLLKVEEAAYIFMGSLSRSVMSRSMPFPDMLEGAKKMGKRAFFEDIAATRSLKMITFGSFPFYLALSVPFVSAKTMDVAKVLEGPAQILSASGIIAAVIYFVGYNMLINNRPFDIIKPKVDIIEGPMMEYSAKWRALAYETRGLVMFALSSIFVALFLGVPFSIERWDILLIHLGLSMVLPAFASILRAFSPVLTFRQIYPISMSLSLLGIFAIALGHMGF